ncbi:MAG: RnfABCDGE type electron transport complex subunit A [Acholeplasmataceae bacterium]|jgi:electron transport complex protein RnfA|nr:RnfABCDGE type electron transport complex subunit A [Acholeplasmataceae bacterium]
MTEFLKIFIQAMLINNIVLMGFLGICSFLGVSTKMKNAVGMSAAVFVVVVVSTFISFPLYHYVLVPLKIDYIDTIAFILVIASVVQLIEMFLKKSSPGLYKGLGIFLPLITTNCLVLNASKVVAQYTNWSHMIAYALGTAIGYMLAMIVFSAIRERLSYQAVPKSFQGVPIALITAALMALAFMGFQGVI